MPIRSLRVRPSRVDAEAVRRRRSAGLGSAAGALPGLGHAGHHLVDVAAAAGVGHLAARAADRGAAHGGLLRVRGGSMYPRGYRGQSCSTASRRTLRRRVARTIVHRRRGGSGAIARDGSRRTRCRVALSVGRAADRLPRRWWRGDPAQGRVDLAEALPIVAPVGVERRDLVGVAGHEVPPHEDRLRERDAAEDHQAGRLAGLDVDLGAARSRGPRSAPDSSAVRGAVGSSPTRSGPSRAMIACSKSGRSGNVVTPGWTVTCMPSSSVAKAAGDVAPR